MRRLVPLTSLVLVSCSTPRSVAPAIMPDTTGALAIVDALAAPDLSPSAAERVADFPANAGAIAWISRFDPKASRATFVQGLVAAARKQPLAADPFGFAEVERRGASIRTTAAALEQAGPAMMPRVAARLRRLSNQPPRNWRLLATAGGNSDGFIIPDQPGLDLFVALDRSQGDLDGIEHLVTHEGAHLLAKQIALDIPAAQPLLRDFNRQRPLDQLLAFTLWEGTANLAADARAMRREGPYLRMWRDRYVRQLEPARLRANFADWSAALEAVAAGRMSFGEAFGRGLSAQADSRYYFVGMAMAEAIEQARGAAALRRVYAEPPAAFFKTYAALAAADHSLPQLSLAATVIINALPDGWPNQP